MALPSYPGVLLIGEALTASRLQGLLKPIFESLDPDLGDGVKDENIKTIGQKKIKDVAAVQSSSFSLQTFQRPVSFGSGFKFANSIPMPDEGRPGAAPSTIPTSSLKTGMSNLVSTANVLGAGYSGPVIYSTMQGEFNGAFLFIQDNGNGHTKIRLNADGTNEGPINSQEASGGVLTDVVLRLVNFGLIMYQGEVSSQWFAIEGSGAST